VARSNLKTSLATFKVGLPQLLAYRFKLVMWVVSGVLEPVVWSVLWYVMAKESEDAVLAGAQVMTYYLFIGLVSRLTWSWTFDDLRSEILQGKYSKYLLWPANIVAYRFGMDMANKGLTLVALLPLWVVWLLVLRSKGLFAFSIGGLPVFALGLGLAIGVRFLVDMTLAHVALWFGRTDGIKIAYHSVSRVLGGITVPLALLPVWASGIAALLPFRYMYSFPVEALLGLVKGEELVRGVGIAVGWLFMSALALVAIMKFGLTRYEATDV